MIVSGTEGEGAGVYAGKNRGLQCAKPHRSDFLPVAERNLRTEELGDLNTKPAASSELKNHPTEDLKPDSIKLVSNMPISKKDRVRHTPRAHLPSPSQGSLTKPLDTPRAKESRRSRCPCSQEA